MFLPSCQSWVFDWASKVVIIALHGRKTCERVNVNVFDQAANQHTPFDNNMINTLLRFCRYHRGIQKSAPIRKKISSFATRLILKNFYLLCDYVACGVETEKEFVFLMNYIRMYVKIQHNKGLLSDLQLDELNCQLSCINRNKSHIVNHYFMKTRRMKNKTTIANECRHRNYKYEDDMVHPNFNMAVSAHKMNQKRKHGVNRKLKREATIVNATSS